MVEHDGADAPQCRGEDFEDPEVCTAPNHDRKGGSLQGAEPQGNLGILVTGKSLRETLEWIQSPVSQPKICFSFSPI